LSATAPGGVAVDLLGVGLLGPGLPGWAASRALLAGAAAWTSAPTPVPTPARLPPTERRRAGLIIKCAIAVADEACAGAGLDPAMLATVFASSSGDPANCHALCEALAAPDPFVSPTRFTNSVHNASAGYWHIATASRAPSTSLCAFDASFGAGLLEAASQCALGGAPVLLVAVDTPYPEPLHSVRPLPDAFATALVLGPAGTGACVARLALALEPATAAATTPLGGAGLEALRAAIPAARALPLLAAAARMLPAPAGAGDPENRPEDSTPDARRTAAAIVLDLQPGLALRVAVAPGTGA
jgi:hypothetical protein